MDRRYIHVFMLLVGCIIIGILLYFAYKFAYESHINKGLKSQKPQHKMISPSRILKIYLAICVITVFVVIVNVANKKNVSCTLDNGQILLAISDESEVKKALYDIFSEDDAYIFQRKKVNEHITILYATGSKAFGYVLKFDLGREPLDGESIVINADGAMSYMEADELHNGVFYTVVTGSLKSKCDVNKDTFEIYNFAKGKNTNKFYYKESFTIVNGGIEL